MRVEFNEKTGSLTITLEGSEINHFASLCLLASEHPAALEWDGKKFVRDLSLKCAAAID